MLKAGTLLEFEGSMAEAIDKEYINLWNKRHKNPLPDSSESDRRELFIAIAQGVISHLQKNASGGFAVTVSDGQGTVEIRAETLDEIEEITKRDQ